jgi:L-lactate utilization protein LutB
LPILTLSPLSTTQFNPDGTDAEVKTVNTPVKKYWDLRVQNCQHSLEENHFDAFIAETPSDAKRIVIDQIFPAIQVKSVAWGDSLTLYTTGILEFFKDNPEIDLIETFDEESTDEVIMERRRNALLADLFFSGTNAVTESGTLVNLDMVGNRVGGMVFGPKYVVVLAGRNKIVADLNAAMDRIKDLAAPANAIRHAMKTPCVKTSYCLDCNSPDRICNVWTIHEKSYPKGRIKVILINQDLGL